MHTYIHAIVTFYFLRPGLVGAHSKTGHANLRDWFYTLVYSVNHLRHYPTGMTWDDGYTDIIPVDRVAQGIVELSLMNNNGKKQYIWMKGIPCDYGGTDFLTSTVIY